MLTSYRPSMFGFAFPVYIVDAKAINAKQHKP